MGFDGLWTILQIQVRGRDSPCAMSHSERSPDDYISFLNQRIGAEIAERRTALGLSVYTLAKAAAVSDQFTCCSSNQWVRVWGRTRRRSRISGNENVGSKLICNCSKDMRSPSIETDGAAIETNLGSRGLCKPSNRADTLSFATRSLSADADSSAIGTNGASADLSTASYGWRTVAEPPIFQKIKPCSVSEWIFWRSSSFSA